MEFRNTIIISNYDSGYNQTIWIDGKEIEQTHPIKDKIVCGYLIKEEISAIMKEYKRSILICEDGGIEYYQYSD